MIWITLDRWLPADSEWLVSDSPEPASCGSGSGGDGGDSVRFLNLLCAGAVRVAEPSKISKLQLGSSLWRHRRQSVVELVDAYVRQINVLVQRAQPETL